MTTIYYSKGKITLSLIAGIVLFFVGVWMYGEGHRKVAFAGFLFAVMGPILTLGSFKMLLGDPVALQFDNRGVSGSTMWRKFDVRWQDVESVAISTTTVSSSFGLFKSSSNSLEIKTQGGLLGGRKFSISPGFLSLGAGGLEGIALQLERARSGGGVAKTTAPVAAPARAQAPRDSLEGLRPQAFDADEAFARYMANRGEAEAPPMPAPPPAAYPQRQAGGFGRKGL